MASRTWRVVAAAVLLTCLWCCIAAALEDDNDPSLLKGTDTESTLVLVAMCVGGTIAFVRYVFDLPKLKVILDVSVQVPLAVFAPAGRRGVFFVVPIPLEPALELRI